MLYRSLIFLFCFTAVLSPLYAAPPRAEQARTDHYRFQLGDYQVTALLDGVSSREPASIALQPQEVSNHLKRHRIEKTTAASNNAFLIHTGSRLILVDTGNKGGKVVESLIASGYHPEQVDTILLTHFHPDHVSGLLDDGALAFPNADVLCDRRESDYWLSEEQEMKAPEALKARFAQIQEVFKPVQEAGKLAPFEPSSRLFPGIEAVPAPGHTPGHTAYLVESGNKGLLFWGDTVHIQQAQFAAPELTVKYDSDTEAAVKSRRALLEMADRQALLIASPHISFPGLGHVIKEGSGYRWIPVPYGTDF
ncbi:MAG: MBL fold metallo-hydrolase [Vulcanimicrobiota bacterium]